MESRVWGVRSSRYDIRYSDMGSALAEGFRLRWAGSGFTDWGSEGYTYAQMAQRIKRFHIYFQELGLEPGDRIALVGRNSPHWAIAFLSVMTYGAVVVPILHEFKPGNIHHLVNHSDARLLFCGDHIWDTLVPGEMPGLMRIVSLGDWSVLHDALDAALGAGLEERVDLLFGERYPDGVGPDDLDFYPGQGDELAEINYTSGSTGFSKGAMIPYRALLSNLEFAREVIPLEPGDREVILLPMAHAYGQMFEFLYHVVRGADIYTISRRPTPQILVDVFGAVRPGIILMVPLILEKIYKSRIRREINRRAVRWLLRMPIVERHIRKRFCDSLDEFFGGSFREIIVGGSGLNPEVERFLKMIGFRFTVGYGMTECHPIISYSPWSEHRTGSTGRVVRGMEMRIAEVDPESGVGEIEVRGENLMLGYYKEPGWTKEAVDEEGWLRTGDRGYIDEDGFLFIRGRSKNMILGPSGQNIYPIECLINTFDYLSESLVIDTDGRLIALVVPDYSALDRDGMTKSDLEPLLEEYRAAVNGEQPAYSQIARMVLYPEEFEKTPKRSIKRYLYTHPHVLDQLI